MTPSISLPKLPAHLVTELRFVQGCLENDFIEATVFLAGGCVRDVIIGRRDPKDVDVSGAEMTDARRRRLDRLAAASKAVDRARDRTEDDPGRQNPAPGGGRTRSR